MPDYLSMGELTIIPAPAGFGPYAELSGGTPHPRARGRVFRKHLLTLGPLHYKGKTYDLNDAWYGQLERNFNAGVSMTQVPLADAQNRHTEDPMRNAGEIIGLERVGQKVYDLIDVRDPDVAQRLADGRIMGASAFLNMDYLDTRSSERVGPALLHHCLTNRPHVLDLEPYQEIAASVADMDWDATEPVVLAQEDGMPTKEELIAQLKNDHGVDVAALEAAAAVKLSGAELTSQIVEALRGSGAVQLSGDGAIDSETITGAIVELAGSVKGLQASNDELRLKDARREVAGYISAGRLLPKAEDKAVEMVLSGDTDGLDAFLAPEKEPYVRLDAQDGFNGPDGEAKHTANVDQELERLAAQHKELFEKQQGRSGSVPQRR